MTKKKKEIYKTLILSIKLELVIKIFALCLFISSNTNEVIRDNFRPSFTKRFYTQKKSTKTIKCKQATFIQMFLYAQKALKNKRATFTHK